VKGKVLERGNSVKAEKFKAPRGEKTLEFDKKRGRPFAIEGGEKGGPHKTIIRD